MEGAVAGRGYRGVLLGQRPKQEGPSLKELHAKIGQQALEIDFLAGALGKLDGSGGKR